MCGSSILKINQCIKWLLLSTIKLGYCVGNFQVQMEILQIVKSNSALREPYNELLAIKMVWVQSSDTQFWFSIF